MSEDPQPWWLRALAPLRSEAAMFRVLLYVAGAMGALVVIVVLVRAVT